MECIQRFPPLSELDGTDRATQLKEWVAQKEVEAPLGETLALDSLYFDKNGFIIEYHYTTNRPSAPFAPPPTE